MSERDPKTGRFPKGNGKGTGESWCDPADRAKTGGSWPAFTSETAATCGHTRANIDAALLTKDALVGRLGKYAYDDNDTSMRPVAAIGKILEYTASKPAAALNIGGQGEDGKPVEIVYRWADSPAAK